MLSELLKQSCKFEFGESEFEMRFTLAALLELENRGLKYSDIFAEKITQEKILAFFRAGLVQKIDDTRLVRIAEITGYEKLWSRCIEAMILSFPKPKENVVRNPPSPNDEEFSFVRLRTLVCDVMGKSEEFFWQSTLAELLERWQEYAIAMGYAKEPERILEYDEEGM